MQFSSHKLTLSIPIVVHCWCMQVSSHKLTLLVPTVVHCWCMQVSAHNLTLSVPTVGHCWCMQFSSHNSHEKRLSWSNTLLLMTFAREIWKSALSVRYILLLLLLLLGQPHETVLPTSATNSQIRKVANYFIRGCCFGAYRLISAQSKVKITVPCERWDNFLLAYLCVLTLLLVLTHYTMCIPAFSSNTLHHVHTRF